MACTLRRTRCSGRRRDDGLQRRVDQVDRHLGLSHQTFVEPPQQRSPAHEVDALDDEVLRQLWRGLRQASEDGVDHGRHRLVDGLANLAGVSTMVFGKPAHEVSAANLGTELTSRSDRPTQIVILISSAVRSPTAMPCSRRT